MSTERLDSYVSRFAGDSGNGRPLVGDRFTGQAAAFGNDLATFPNYPAQIRAPCTVSRRSRTTSPAVTSSPPVMLRTCSWR